MTNIEYANSLEQVAAFYRANPEMKQPHGTMWLFCYERDEFIKNARTLARGGRVEKIADDLGSHDPKYHAKRTFGGIEVDVQISRNTVCRLVRPAVYECPDSLLEEAVA
jgi:hypothetical protein